MNDVVHGVRTFTRRSLALARVVPVSVLICLHLCLLLLTSCSSKPTDMRTLVPADALVYLDIKDLEAALAAIVESAYFSKVAPNRPDFSALAGVQLAMAVTGFELTEEELTIESSVGRVQPRFVAVADTHSWNWQARAFAEQKLDGVVQQLIGNEAKMERNAKSEASGGLWLTWTRSNRQVAHALVIDSLIYFGNDESAIEKCLAVKRGETASVASGGKVSPPSPETLSLGYVSADGVGQIASIAGLKFASEASEDEDIQSAIAGLVPRLLRGAVTEIRWTSRKTEKGVEDKYFIAIPPETANVLMETLAPADGNTERNNAVISQLPAETTDATRYNLKNPQLAWRSILLTTQKGLGPIEAAVLGEVSSLLFEPYGIRDPETFLSSLTDEKGDAANVVSARLSDESEDTVILASIASLSSAQKALSPDLKPLAPAEGGPAVWGADEADVRVYFGPVTRIASKEDHARLGNATAGSPRSELLTQLASSKAPIVTVGNDDATGLHLIAVLVGEVPGDVKAVSHYLTETRFTRSGMERQTVSDFGLLGSIIAAIHDTQTRP